MILLSLVAILALITAACGSDADTASSDDEPADAETSDTATADTEETESETADTEEDESEEDESEEADASESAEEAADYSDFKVVMILDGSSEDGGWNTTHMRGGLMVEEAFPGIDMTYVEEIDPGQEATNAFQDAVDAGADLVIGTTFYQFDMMDIADANPDVHFLTWAGFEPQPNVGHFDGASEDGRYLDGMVAGSLTESGIIGYPVGFPFPEVQRVVNAFTLGAQEMNPDVEVQVVYLNTWFDPALEQQAAEALANAGADVIAHEVGSQVYATVMAQNGGHVIGYTNDWSDFEPEAWASSFLYNWGTYYISQIEDILADEFEPGFTFGGLADGFIEFAPYGPDVTEETLALVEERKAQIIDGSFDMFAGPLLDNQGNEVVAEGATIPFEERHTCCDYLIQGVSGEVPAE